MSSEVLERTIFRLSSWGGNSAKLVKRSKSRSLTVGAVCLKAFWQVEWSWFYHSESLQKKKKFCKTCYFIANGHWVLFNSSGPLNLI